MFTHRLLGSTAPVVLRLRSTSFPDAMSPLRSGASSAASGEVFTEDAEIETATKVTILAVRHQLEDDYH